MIHLILLIITFATTTIAGSDWISGFGGLFEPDQLRTGLPYSLSILFVLGCHEFGHYFAARYHRVSVTLPYFIPFPLIPGFINFGTMGAVIRTRSMVPDNKVMFDIGVYGPIAGFVASILVLVHGYTHLPDTDYILAIHPDFFSQNFGERSLNLQFGDTILLAVLRNLLTDSHQFIPPMSEIYHYPYLCAGWFGLFVTALNMIPVGQLDGGHIIYSMFGSAVHERIARLSMGLLLIFGIIGIIEAFWGWSLNLGWVGWLLWFAILRFLIKVHHPPVIEFQELNYGRKILGYLSLLVLAVSFTPCPISVS